MQEFIDRISFWKPRLSAYFAMYAYSEQPSTHIVDTADIVVEARRLIPPTRFKLLFGDYISIRLGKGVEDEIIHERTAKYIKQPIPVKQSYFYKVVVKRYLYNPRTGRRIDIASVELDPNDISKAFNLIREGKFDQLPLSVKLVFIPAKVTTKEVAVKKEEQKPEAPVQPAVVQPTAVTTTEKVGGELTAVPLTEEV